MMRGNLAAQLAADRAAPARYHNDLTGYIPHYRVQIHFHRITPEQVVDVHIF